MNQSAGSKHMIVIDRDESTRKILRATISLRFDDAIVIRETSNGEEGLEMMLDVPADIVISDVEPNDTTGLELAQIITDPYNGWPETRFILTSEKIGDNPCELADLAAKAFNLGIELFSKPIDLAQMLRKINPISKKKKPV